MNAPTGINFPKLRIVQIRREISLILSLIAVSVALPDVAQGQNAVFEFKGSNETTEQPSGGKFSSFDTTDNLKSKIGRKDFTTTEWDANASDPQYVSFWLEPTAGNFSFVKSLSFDVWSDKNGPKNLLVGLFGSTATSARKLAIDEYSTPGKSKESQLSFDFKDTITGDSLEFRFYGTEAKNTKGELTFDDVKLTSGSADFAKSSASIGLTEDTNLYTESRSLQLSGTISGRYGLDKIGRNSATLTGKNSYEGNTTVSEGTLLVGAGGIGSIASSVTVSSGATLGGSGQIKGNVTLNTGATYAPGNNGIGSQKVDGNVVLKDSSIFAWQLAPPVGSSLKDNQGAYDRLGLSGELSGKAIFNIELLGANNSFSDPFWSSDKTWSDIVSSGSGATLQSVFTTFSGSGVASNGTVKNIGQFSFTGNTLNFTSFSTVPEPTSALVGLLIAAGLMRRTRR